MKLRNKKTGEIGNLVLNINPNRESYSVLSTENGDTICGNLVVADYDTLAELNEEWEDCEEPKEYWFMDYGGRIKAMNDSNDEEDVARKEIGNYFETREEAELAVRKLKAWKRLEDKGFSFHGYDDGYKHDFNSGHIEFYVENDGGVLKDLDLLFGGDEWK